jgi:hypothetical protein
MATLTIQDVASSGAIPSYAAANVSGDQFSNDGRTYVHIKAGAAGNTNVTIGSQVACDQGSTHNTTVAVATNTEKMIGPFATNRYNDGSGYVQLAYSSVTNVTIGAFSL